MMSKVLTPFARLRNTAGRIDQQNSETVGRHRREGWFDESDNWHDAHESDAAVRAQ
jgi:hypothetical protein